MRTAPRFWRPLLHPVIRTRAVYCSIHDLRLVDYTYLCQRKFV